MRKLAALFLIPVPGLAATSSQLDLATTFGVAFCRYCSDIVTGLVTQTHACTGFRSAKRAEYHQQLPVGTRERVMIIQVGEEQYLIGVTTQSIQLLAKLDNPLTQEELPATAFSNQLMQLLKKHETDSKT
uniref:FliO/MopB family protein n=1 Tax=Vibrio cholerae TaxID=666 RepID=UPI003F58EC97